MEDTVHKCVPEPPSVDVVAAELVDTPSFTVPVAKFVTHEVEKNSLDKANMKREFVKLTEAVEKRRLRLDTKF